MYMNIEHHITYTLACLFALCTNIEFKGRAGCFFLSGLQYYRVVLKMPDCPYTAVIDYSTQSDGSLACRGGLLGSLENEADDFRCSMDML